MAVKDGYLFLGTMTLAKPDSSRLRGPERASEHVGAHSKIAW